MGQMRGLNDLVGTSVAAAKFGGTKEKYRLAASMGKVLGAEIIGGTWVARLGEWKKYVDTVKMGRPKKKKRA